MNDSFTADYASILNKIDEIDPVRYAASRNYIDGAVTRLSPYVSRGVISVKQIAGKVLQKSYKRYEAEKFLQQLAWREYFQRVWQFYGEDIWQDIKQTQPGYIHTAIPQVIVSASTGIEAVDNSIKILEQTGYMHNHVRMYTASIACNIAKAHWKLPAKWMYYYLLDGDLASNNCSWQWVAGAFSSKKYYCNQQNIDRYTQTIQAQTFLDYSYEAIAAMAIPALLTQLTGFDAKTNLPATQFPTLDTTLPTLIYNSYNLDPQWRAGEQVNRVLLLEPSHFSRYMVSEKVIDFILKLAHNISGIQVYTGEVNEIVNAYTGSQRGNSCIISKEHPAFTHYPGIKDDRDWMFPMVNGYYPSFFAYWKNCSRYLQDLPS
jgi:deoxyribodipyrimidine photo-lyase